MEIMKVFSDSYDEERIYSVIMNEEELELLFSIQGEIVRAGRAAKKISKSNWIKELGNGNIKAGRESLRGDLYKSGRLVKSPLEITRIDGSKKVVHNAGIGLGKAPLKGRTIDQKINMKGAVDELGGNVGIRGKAISPSKFRKEFDPIDPSKGIFNQGDRIKAIQKNII